MQRRRLCASAAMLALGLGRVDAAHADDALSLMQRVSDRPIGRDLTLLTRMELAEKGRAPRVRELVTYRLQRGRGEAWNLARFLEPKDIAGTGLLSIDKADGSNEQWLYLPELDRVRRIAGDRKGGRFVGSDFYYEDLRERKPAADRHRLVGKETLNGVACEVVESTPIDADDSVYRKRLSWIDPSTALVHRVDYFERDDRSPSKRWLLGARKQVQGFWTVTDSRLSDLASGHETRLVVQQAIYDRKLPTKLFTQQALSDQGLESEYRP
ncbi:MAG: outer membrane lipoprotein-sorting protein [Burkholderiales bacterium]|nr:outer membrane lipoprotein-sorting protein [Burkholderiales bacterium]